MVDAVLAQDRRFLPHDRPAGTFLSIFENRNEKLSRRVAELETTSGEHTGQLKVLTAFVQGALDKEVERKAEQAAARHIEKLIAQRSVPPADDR